MSNRMVEAEVRERNLELDLSQEIHLFNQARNLIGETREGFTIEDQGCIRRIEMLETQRRDEYAIGLVEIGNRAESVLRARSEEHSEEIQRMRHIEPKHTLGFRDKTYQD